MTDTEVLDLIEHNRWSVYPQDGFALWAIESETFVVFGATVREAVKEALNAQAKQSDAQAAAIKRETADLRAAGVDRPVVRKGRLR